VPGTGGAPLGQAATAIDVTIPVANIDCGNKGMTENLRKAMDASRHPTVRFRMSSYSAAKAAGGSAYEGTLKGTLTIKGTEKPITMKATVTPDGSGGVRAEGSTELETTEYGVPAVKALMGTIKTGTRITIVVTLNARQP
jgi:polyisoprenoid-binding protein YceI